MYLIRGGQSTCKVQGYKQTEAGGYSPIVDFFAPATMISYDNQREKLPLNKDGMVSIPKIHLNSILNHKEKEMKSLKTKEENKMNIEIIKKEKNRVGRPKKHKIELPRHEEFTVGKIAKKFGVEKFVINNEIAKIKKEDPSSVMVVGFLEQEKGKPARVFKLS